MVRISLTSYYIICRSDNLVRLLRYILIFLIFRCQILSLRFLAYLVLYLIDCTNTFVSCCMTSKSRIYKKDCRKDAIKDDEDLTFAWNSTSINRIDRVSF